jgi:hypothetical protein
VGFTVVAQLRGVPMWAGGNSIAWTRASAAERRLGWGRAF